MPFAIYDRTKGRYLKVLEAAIPAEHYWPMHEYYWTEQYEHAAQIEDLFEARKVRDKLNTGRAERLVLAESRFDWRVPKGL